MEDIKSIIAKNLISFRTSARLTQAELAEKINYSDKSISKWEHGLAVPDVLVLKQLADLYGIKVDDFFVINEKSKNVELSVQTAGSKVMVALLSVGLAWLLATLAFVVLLWLHIERSWLSFIVAIPASAIVLIVFSCLWGKNWQTEIFVSILIWSTALCGFLIFYNTRAELLFVLCAPLQILTFMWFGLLHILNKRKQKQK